jgi:Ca2+-transporting ATPase
MPDEPLFSWRLIGWGLLQGVVAFGLVGVILVFALLRGMPEDEIRALSFFSLVLAIVSLIFVNRSFSASLVTAVLRPNPALAWVLLMVAGVLALTLFWPFASGLFRFGPLHPDDLALTAGAGLIVLVALESLKLMWRAKVQA